MDTTRTSPPCKDFGDWLLSLPHVLPQVLLIFNFISCLFFLYYGPLSLPSFSWLVTSFQGLL